MAYDQILSAYKTLVNQLVGSKVSEDSIDPTDVAAIGLQLADLLVPILNGINDFAITGGTLPPNNANGIDFDLYIQGGTSLTFWRKRNGVWVQEASVALGIQIVDGNITLQASVNEDIVTVSAGSWGINNIVYSKATQTQLTLTPANLNFNRIDTVVANNTGDIYLLDGVASSSPNPTSLPANSIVVAYVYIPSSSSGDLPYISDSNSPPVPIYDVPKPWTSEATPLDGYRSHFIGDIEYLFRSKISGNVSEPSLGSTSGAWIQTDFFGFISTWTNFIPYSIGNLVAGDANTNIYRSKVNDNVGVNPNGGLNPDEWELVGAYIGFYFPGTFNLGDVVIVSAESNRIYISAIADNNQPITDIVGNSQWQVIGAPSGIGGNPTSGTLLSSDSPLVITWDTDLVPDDAEGRTYFEKHGPLEKVSIQVTMPDPANDGEATVFPSWRFDEATKNILTIDNQGQKLYYVIGFGADGSSGGGAGISLTTEGTSGPATLTGTVLNIPEYTSGGGGGLTLGETSSTAYRGDRGKTAYDHSQLTSGNPHNVTKTDVGLGSVDNTPDSSKPVSSAQQTAIDAKVQNSLTASTTIAPSATAVNAALGAKISSTEKGAASGVAPLNSSSLIDSAYLPSYVDDVLEYANLAAFPVTGEAGKIYIAIDTSKQYRWSGSVYIELVASPGTTDNVPEGSTNKYWTLARTVGAVLTGYVAGTTHVAVAATDTIMQALQKISGSISSMLTDIGLKAPIASPTFTGTVSGISKSMVGLGSVDNTADTAKPVSTAQQTALDLKSNIAAAQVTITALTFVSDSVSGTTSSPITGNLTGDVTSAQLGVTVLVIHNNGTAPTFDSKFKKLSGSGDYVTGQVNYIYCQYIDATHIIYSINQSA